MNGSGETIENLLKKKAIIYVGKTIESYLDKNETFFLYAAMAIELLGKAVLASKHPSLIVDPKDLNSLFQICGVEGFTNRPITTLKTISGREVLRRCQKLLPRLSSIEGELERLILQRNSLVHIGSLKDENIRSTYKAFLTAIMILSEYLGIKKSEIFGEFKDAIETFLDDTKKEIEKIVEEKIIRAKNNFKNKFSDMDEYTKKAVIKAIEESYRLIMYEEELTECPACGHLGILRGDYEHEWKEWDVDEEGNPIPCVEVTMYPREFECSVCGLKLEDADELDVVGLAEPIEMEGDPKDFVEYDYDDYFE